MKNKIIATPDAKPEVPLEKKTLGFRCFVNHFLLASLDRNDKWSKDTKRFCFVFTIQSTWDVQEMLLVSLLPEPVQFFRSTGNSCWGTDKRGAYFIVVFPDIYRSGSGK